MAPHSLTNFEIKKYYQNEAKFIGLYSRNYLPKITDGAYVINLNQLKLIGILWITLYVNGNYSFAIITIHNSFTNGNYKLIITALNLNIFQKELQN